MQDGMPLCNPQEGPASPRVLVIEAHPAVALTLCRQCQALGWIARSVATVAEFAGTIAPWRPQALVLSLVLPNGEALAFLRSLTVTAPGLPVLCLVEPRTDDAAVGTHELLADFDLRLTQTGKPLRYATLAAFLDGARPPT